MMDPHHCSQLSHETLQYSPKILGDLVLIGGPGTTTHLRGHRLLVPEARISGSGWNGSPFPSSSIQQNGNGFYHPIVDQVGTIADTCSPLHSAEKYHPMLPPSGEISAADGLGHQRPSVAQYSLPDAFPGQQTRVKTPDILSAMRPIALRVPRNLFLPLDTDTPQSCDRIINESQAIADTISSWSHRKHSMTEEIQIPMIMVDAQLFPDECSYTPSSSKCSTSGACLQMMPQEANRASQTHKGGENLTSSTAPISRACAPKDQGAKIKKKQYQCSACCVGFSQRQGSPGTARISTRPRNGVTSAWSLHGPKDAVMFTKDTSKRYTLKLALYHRLYASDCAQTGVTGKLKGQRFRQNCIAPCTS
ncbi:hypothetical protein EI94DRAFT_660130 [Lactarius quietus]|nr:hypothetical protein EI94DRAFT_660130 [Lactarius quietus]